MMAERYSGPHSPMAQEPGKMPPGQIPPVSPRPGGRASRAGRAGWLALAAVPFLLTAFFQAPVILASHLAAAACLIAASGLTREGIRAAESYEARAVARRPAFPRKILGAVLAGFGLALGAYDPAASLFNPMLFAGLGILLHLAAFGADPLRDKGTEGIDSFQRDRVARIVTGAEGYLHSMSEAIDRTGDAGLVRRVTAFQATARDMAARIEADPRDLAAARKYLGVYLMGARDATARFADLWQQSHDPAARIVWEQLLTDLETGFARQSQALLSNSRTDMDIEIDVLRDRLRRDGVGT